MLTLNEDGMRLRNSMPICRNTYPPIVKIASDFTIDDSVLEKPTLLLGEVGSGKSTFLKDKLIPQLIPPRNGRDAAVIFAAKKELLQFYDASQGDILISSSSTEPRCIYNIFEEMRHSPSPGKTLDEITEVLFSGHNNEVQPFFSNSAKDMFRLLTMWMYKHTSYPSNASLYQFINTLTLQDTSDGRLGLLSLINKYPELNRLADYIGNGKSTQALGVLGEFRSCISDIFGNSSFAAAGTLNMRQAVLEGKRIFISYDFSEDCEKQLLFIDMLIDRLLKLSLQENGQRVWFVLDEFALLGHCRFLSNALAYGRGVGFRIIAAMQSTDLIYKNYEESEADALLSLFPNIICFYTSSAKTRQYVSNRYGKNTKNRLCGVSNNEIVDEDVIRDVDFFKIREPGNCLICLSGEEPFIYQGNKSRGGGKQRK